MIILVMIRMNVISRNKYTHYDFVNGDDSIHCQLHHSVDKYNDKICIMLIKLICNTNFKFHD